jgi:hypothetical protein
MSNNELHKIINDIVVEIFTKMNEDNITSSGESYNTKFAFKKNKSINEVSYRKFNKQITVISPRKKINRAINEVNKKLKEINQIIDYSNKVIKENEVNNETFWGNIDLKLNEISKEVVKTFQKIKKIKQ